MHETGYARSWKNLREETWDAIVIGAGPAGALAARQLAGMGLRVLLVEKRRFPRAKVCGGCLNGRALAILDSVGLETLVAQSGGVRLGRFWLQFRGRRASIDLPVGAAVSRDRFDAGLVEAAIAKGACFLPETSARIGAVVDQTRLVQLSTSSQARAVRSRLVLLACGLGGSCLPNGSTLRVQMARRSRIGAGCRVDVGPSDYGEGTIFMAVARHGYVGVVRMEDGSLNVAAAFQPEMMRGHGSPGAAAMAVLTESGMPEIVELPSARWEGTSRLTRQTRPIAEERVFLLGDAAGYVEPFTGEGMTWALASGKAVAPLALRAIERWEPRLSDEWDLLHRRLVRNRQVVCRGAAMFLHCPWLSRLGFEVIARLPGATGHILGHLNATPSFEAH
ncbi:MAG: NAD(P)/FAD-dependent oxidoreductase [Isosphaeraceae bacterium]